MFVYPTVTNLDGIKHTRTMFDQYLMSRLARTDAMGNPLQNDDNSVGFFLRRLEQNIGRVFETFAPPLTFDQDCVTEYDLDPGAENVVYTAVDGTGEARIIGGATKDVRFSSVQAQEVKLKTARIASGFDYTVKELDNMMLAAKNGVAFDIKDGRIKKAIRSLDELSENLGYYGSNEHEMYGLLNNPDVTLVDSAFKPYLTARTANELYAWFIEIYFAVLEQTLDSFQPNVCRMSRKLLQRLSSVRDSESNTTALGLIYEYFNNPANASSRVAFDVRNALSTSWLQRAGVIPSNEDDEILLFYHLSPDTVVRKINTIKSIPLQQEGFSFTGRLYYDVSSVMMPYTKAVNFVKYDTAIA